MQLRISSYSVKKNTLYLINNLTELDKIKDLSENELRYAKEQFKDKQLLIQINQYHRWIFILFTEHLNKQLPYNEALRRAGCLLTDRLNKAKCTAIFIQNHSELTDAAYFIAEGSALSSYQFLKYRAEQERVKNTFLNIEFDKLSITLKDLNQLGIINEAVFIARNFVNEPLNHLNATSLARQISLLGKSAGFKTTILNKTQIEKEKMGGLLAVNRGSIDPPTFSVMEYRPDKALNKQAIVLIGKGVVYDTGGVSLKPTPNSMDRMKSDMSGAALVSAAMYAVAKLKLPLYVVGLIPATDNRPGENAYVPGDIIKMYSGSTVEVLNTDAEGRMILADALHWAKRYKPELVIDFATLTGAAAAVSGPEGMIYMGTANNEVKKSFEWHGMKQYERMIELPLWPEYKELIQSDIADLKNIGGSYAGAITAGKFLEHFTAYPWLHFDIAGVSFNRAQNQYKTAGGTAFGLRMLLSYLIHYGK